MTISTPYPYTLQNGTTADATQVMANFNQIQNDVNANAANNGANNNITSLTGLTTPIAPGSGGTIVYNSSVTTNVANAYTVATTVPSNWSNNQGQGLVWVPNATNTAGTATLTVNTKTTKNIKKLNLAGTIVDVAAGDIVANVQSFVLYDGTQFILTDPVTGIPTNATLKNDGSGNLTTSLFTESTIASGATTDLGTAASNIIAISGSAAVTSLGSSASTANPLYFFRLTGAVLFTYNATSLILEGGSNIQGAAGDTGIAEYLGSGNWKIHNYVRISGKIQRVVRQVITSSGTYTPTPGMVFCDAELLGGGGGGGGANGTVAVATGGGAGSYSKSRLTASQVGASQTATVGAAGTAGTTAGSAGGTGGATSLGALVTTNGGIGGNGSTTAGSPDVKAGVLGGAAGTGEVATAGAPSSPSYYSGGGSASAGGSTLYGAGGLAASFNGGAGPGGNGLGYGSGGGGGCGVAHAGGSGAPGVIIITEYCV